MSIIIAIITVPDSGSSYPNEEVMYPSLQEGINHRITNSMTGQPSNSEIIQFSDGHRSSSTFHQETKRITYKTNTKQGKHTNEHHRKDSISNWNTKTKRQINTT